jgi:hypothetical protein
MIPLTPEEAFDYVYRAVEKFIADGTCWQCALILASAKTGVHRERVEDIWIARQAQRLADPS